MPPPADPTAPLPLLGVGLPLKINDWRSATDNIRGGTSAAAVKVVDEGLEISGTLETPKNGTAFASVFIEAQLLPTPLEAFRGLVLDIVDADGQEFSVSLTVRGAIAGTTFRYRFKPEERGRIEMPFKRFEPTLRGKPARQPAPPLVLDRIETVLIEVEAGPGRREGPFSLVLKGILGLRGEDEPEPVTPARETKWICDACGTMNFDFSQSCTRCGSERDSEAKKAAAAAAAEAAAKSKKWACSACGAQNFQAYDSCYKCGVPRR